MRCYFNYILKLLGAIYTAGGDQDAYYFRILLNESYQKTVKHFGKVIRQCENHLKIGG